VVSGGITFVVNVVGTDSLSVRVRRGVHTNFFIQVFVCWSTAIFVKPRFLCFRVYRVGRLVSGVLRN
jgi:hypothetical protein